MDRKRITIGVDKLIKPAQLYAKELAQKFWEIAYDERYMFAHDGYVEEYKPTDNNMTQHEFASLSAKDEVLGYIRYNIDQRSRVVSGLYAVNFTDNMIYARDLLKCIDDIFSKYKFRKLKYGVIIGNPVEKTYDRMTEKYGGRIIGTAKDDVILMDGKIYDHKSYEIFAEEYHKHKSNCKKDRGK